MKFKGVNYLSKVTKQELSPGWSGFQAPALNHSTPLLRPLCTTLLWRHGALLMWSCGTGTLVSPSALPRAARRWQVINLSGPRSPKGPGGYFLKELWEWVWKELRKRRAWTRVPRKGLVIAWKDLLNHKLLARLCSSPAFSWDSGPWLVLYPVAMPREMKVGNP